MTRLEELEELISKQEVVASDKHAAYKKVADAYEDRVKKTIEALLSAVAPVTCYVSATGYRVSGRVDLKLDGPNHSYGSGFDFYYDTHHFSEDPDKYFLTVNIGTCGSFGIDDEEQFAKYRVFAQFLDSFKDMEDTFKEGFDLLTETCSAYYKEQGKLENLTREKREIERKAEEQKTIDSIKPGTLYVNSRYTWYSRNSSGFKGYKYVKLVSLTEKSANLEVGYVNHRWQDNWEASDTYRMNKQEFFEAVIHGRLKETTIEAELSKED
jgi:hypothetical protein